MAMPKPTLLLRVLCALAAVTAVPAAHAQLASASPGRGNLFNDPFVQVTRGIAACPVPSGPSVTPQEVKAQAHSRAERGTSCYQAGRCRLPNAYLYDKEIISRVKKAIDADGSFTGTSVWAEGQRRWVGLKGCVRTRQQAEAIARLVRSIDDVEMVVNQLQVVRDHANAPSAKPP